jgi:TetR/AcrR family transcriptional regulator, repressor for uid operon
MPKLSKEQQLLRRQHILAAAQECFGRSGFHRTTIHDVCQVAGISAGALYLYFDSKESLIAGIVESEQARVINQFASLHGTDDVLAGVTEVMRNCLAAQSADKAVLFLEIVAESSRNPDVRKALQRVDEAILGSLRDVLLRARQDGRILPRVEIDRLVDMMAATVDGLFIRRVIDPSFDPSAVISTLLHTLRSLLVMPNPAELETSLQTG